MRSLVVAARPSPLRCALCHDDLDVAAWCAECGTVVHPGCAREVERCPTLGCAAVRALPRHRSRVVAARAAEPERRVGWAIVVLVNVALSLVGAALALASRPSPPAVEVVRVPATRDTHEAVGLDPWRPGECFCR